MARDARDRHDRRGKRTPSPCHSAVYWALNFNIVFLKYLNFTDQHALQIQRDSSMESESDKEHFQAFCVDSLALVANF